MSKIIYHKHHIIPRHMGGTDDPTNIVVLTVEEHAEAHRLLWEQYGKPQDLWAWKILIKQFDWSETERQAWIEFSREKMLKNNIGTERWKKMSSDANPMKILRTNNGSFKKGQKFGSKSTETKEKMRQSKKGKLNPNYGNSKCANHLNRDTVTCPYCNLTLTKGNAKRWHFDKCKKKFS